jgi:hypothetical protein
MAEIQLTYMPVRGRCEPVFLLLVDSGVKFTNVTIGPDKWMEMKRPELSVVGPPQFPYSALPVLKVIKPEGEGGTNEFILGETTAILTFLDEYLWGEGCEKVGDIIIDPILSGCRI